MLGLHGGQVLIGRGLRLHKVWHWKVFILVGCRIRSLMHALSFWHLLPCYGSKVVRHMHIVSIRTDCASWQ